MAVVPAEKFKPGRLVCRLTYGEWRAGWSKPRFEVWATGPWMRERVDLTMRKIYVFVVAALAVLMFGIVAASASAATLMWLEGGLKMIAASASETTGEILLRNTNGGGIGVNIEILCSGSFDGSVGPGAEDIITEVLDLSKKQVTLSSMLACTAENSNCISPLVAPINLPWLSVLELMGSDAAPLFLDLLIPGNGSVGIFGNPGWDMDCITIIGLVEEECAGEVGANLENIPAENDVLGTFSEAEIVTESAQAFCTGGLSNTGLVNTDAAALIFLTNGKSLAVSYE